MPEEIAIMRLEGFCLDFADTCMVFKYKEF